MTVLVVALWLGLQIPAGILLGRLLQRGMRRPIPVPVAIRRRSRP